MAFDKSTRENLEKELLSFLSLDARGDVKYVALRYFLEMTGSAEGCQFIKDGEKILQSILSLTNDSENDIIKDALLASINLSADEATAEKMMTLCPDFIPDLLRKTLKKDFPFADEASSIIANSTRNPANAQRVADHILKPDSLISMEKIVSALCLIDYNKNAKLHYLSTVLANLTQVSSIRKTILDKEQCIIQKLLPFTEYKDSLTRRGGIVGTLKNCCFESDYHEWLLSEEVDIVSRLLLPLAGPEEFDEDDMEKLPIDLQYLPPSKEREHDPDIRAMLLEAISLLCSTKHGRLQIKAMNAYVILRELHKWERDPKAKLACQKLCEMLVSDEPQPGMEELHQVTVPADLEEKFNQMDLDLLSDFTTEQLNEKNEEEK